MISIIYPYRNRDLQRVKNSLDSLDCQSCKHFKVHFIDYGSSEDYSKKVEELCARYFFVSYTYCHTQFQPWNKSRALNSVIKTLNEGFCFVADVDMIFHPDFVKTAIGLQWGDRSVYFQVGFLRPEEMPNEIDFSGYRKSTSEATGLTLFPVKVLQELRGFDEFYHFWGAEDTDMHVRIKNAGYPVEFYDEKVLMLHQWHPSYRSKESSTLTKQLQVSGIVQLNHQHLKFAEQNNVTIVNLSGWGEVPSGEEIKELQHSPVSFELTTEKRQVDDLLYGQLPSFKGRTIKVSIRKDEFYKTPKYKLKKVFGKKVPEFYSMKEVNDKVLLHLISFYRHRVYLYRILKDKKEIEFSIRL